MASFSRSKGFTLIELSIVVAIVGILAAVSIPIFDTFSKDSKIEELKSEMLAAAAAQEKYYLAKGLYSPEVLDLHPYGFPKNDEKRKMKYGTGILIKNGVGLSYWVHGIRCIDGKPSCWLYISSLMGTTEATNFRELKSGDTVSEYKGVPACACN